MTEGITPDDLRQQHAAAISRSETFVTQGVSEEAAKSYLKTSDGQIYLQRLVQADPTSSASKITDRAVSQIISGRELPRMELNSEPLVKIVPTGSTVSPYSPFFAKQSAFEDALHQGHNLSDRFGLPIQSEAARYDVYQIKPKAPTEVFVSHIAPTSELGGLVAKPGGAEQYLVPHRGLYSEPTYLKSLDNSLAVQAERSAGAGLSSSAASRGLGALGAAAVIYDATATGQRTADLLHAGNRVGGQSEILHFGGRNLGMLAGAELGAATGAALGVESGPGLLATGAVGGIAGAIGGSKIADAIDHHRIYNQSDSQGSTWRYDPQQPAQGWTRQEQHRTLTADAALSNQLNFQASSTAVQVALANPATPKDPYAQPAAAGDAPSARNAPWTRDAQTHAWTRELTDQILEHGMAGTRVETANPMRAAQLDQAARQTIAENIATSPQGMAQRYQAAYAQYGWNQYGAMPDAVTHALKTSNNIVQASDGHTYTRAVDGQWSTPGTLWGTNTASGNLRDELDATRQTEAARASVSAPVAAPARLDQPAHPDHPLYLQARNAVHRVDAQIGHTPDQKSDNLSAAVAVAARSSGLKHIDHVVLSEDGGRAFAVQGDPGSPARQIAHPVDTALAVQTSIVQSTATMARVNQQQAQAQAPTAMQNAPEAQQQRSATPLSR
ncbi:uncharacterized protein YfiM (DUF2279 family) [Rhodanobacter sp. ANJX3]|uniref:XVIPCD domain-containing protein n=1 Tax=Rhodanobacter sp. ANJX3 TaxID=2723083 RepID=UPI001608913F|nr:XVIPCD domain-containing protein [Rhodanobacter sp. ANJX3]MBB5360439.1 uncharacterized protein YfiM (DUF2279 family) [Rhodanobacter sp. ANJX3]